ncbi:MAG: transposase [Alphaproteobacteria bacterium]|jgi:putative transposase|nr:transposase [Alphaproteobacteria bacterium]MBT4084603.1 transposase [Alphaproteobacteria bacterium]MBT4546043.1 transposase [Alphaproteobacteria bacterium]MBT7746292.1 transposase [Alphaproteobacteria bacterium]
MKSRFSDEKIIGILKKHEAGITVKELCRKYGMSDATYYKWKAKYSGLEINEARRLRSLEDENRHLKKLVAYLSLDKMALEEVLKEI